MLNTLVMLLLWKHLWRALWLKEEVPVEIKSSCVGGCSPGDNSEVAIQIGECVAGAATAAGCLPVEENFLIEIVFALFDFFRISQTKQD